MANPQAEKLNSLKKRLPAPFPHTPPQRRGAAVTPPPFVRQKSDLLRTNYGPTTDMVRRWWHKRTGIRRVAQAAPGCRSLTSRRLDVL